MNTPDRENQATAETYSTHCRSCFMEAHLAVVLRFTFSIALIAVCVCCFRTGMTSAQEVEFLFSFGIRGPGSGQFEHPLGIEVDSSGNIYVADDQNYRVQVFDNTGAYQFGFGYQGSAHGDFQLPQDVAVNDAGDIYVADRNNNRVEVYNSVGHYQSTIGTSGSGDGEFWGPEGIALDDNGNLYVTDFSNGRVQVFDDTGAYQYQFGSPGEGEGDINFPKGLALDDTGNIYIISANSHDVQVFDNAGIFQFAFAANAPSDIAVDAAGSIYVAENFDQVEVFDSNGVFQYQFGTVGSGDGEFELPQGIAVDDRGRIYVTDFWNYRVQVWQIVPEPLAGDFNNDNKVDGSDFLMWQRGESPDPLSQSDLAAWEANYGMVATLSASSAAVPEPTTCALALAALCLAISRRRSR